MKFTLATLFLLMTISIGLASGQEIVIHKFAGSDGVAPNGLVADKNNNLYGTTNNGGAFNVGNVFELTPPASGIGPWTETTLYSFTGGPDGGFPGTGALIFDAEGNLYGATLAGGFTGNETCALDGCGVVFELSPPSQSGGSWTETVLYAFQGFPNNDGSNPGQSLIFDPQGNLYGTTFNGGGTKDFGTVFELSPPAQSGGPWTETTIHRFAGGASDGEYPNAGLIRDAAGHLYGTSYKGGSQDAICAPDGCGTVFRLSPPSSSGGQWSAALLYAFRGEADGQVPLATVVGVGNALYGTTPSGGGSHSAGIVYQIAEVAGQIKKTTIYEFQGGSDGTSPEASLTADAAGNLYGTTTTGGGGCTHSDRCGTVFKLTPPSQGGGAWTETVLHAFQGGDGAYPASALLFGKGQLLGTTQYGGGSTCNGGDGCGVVFRLKLP